MPAYMYCLTQYNTISKFAYYWHQPQMASALSMMVVNEEVLAKCDKVKFLGVKIDKHLSWKDHIEGMRKNCLGGLVQLHRVRKPSLLVN